MVRLRVRIRFCKRNDLRWIGHRDLARSMERLFRRAGLQLGMSEGFHPKPRMSFPSALALGIEGIDEVMELELAREYSAEEVRRRLADAAPPGLDFTSVDLLPPGTRKARLQSATYRIPVPRELHCEVSGRVERLMKETSRLVRKLNKQSQVDLRQSLEELNLREGVLEMRLGVSAAASASARDVLQALGLAELERDGILLTRTRVELQ